jgi:DNA invertase Pin-like site-specific DNA recombinase
MNTKHSGRYVAYYRVSTARQGRSGLGLEAQRQAVGEHLNGGNWKLVAGFTEVESGKRSDRPRLAEALKACRLQGAKLIIAKLDRLARNVAFISNLMESKVEFEAVDFPQANRLTIHIMAAIAEHEAKMISDRTRAALAAAKARGKRLGGFRGRAGTAADCAKARQAKSLTAKSRAADLAPVIEDLRTAGANSLRSIANELNERGISAPRGGVWSAAQVRAALLFGFLK